VTSAAGVLLAIAGILLGIGCSAAPGAEVVRLTPARAPVLVDAPRFGLNLGGASTWGAEQLPANVLKNPGFEAPIERSLVVVKALAGQTVTDDTPWTARADGLWDGAEFEVLSGAAAGQRGTVASYRRAAAGGAGVFALAPFPAGLRAADALAVTTTGRISGIPLWWSSSGEPRTIEDARPGSGGRQAAYLQAAYGQPSRLAHHLDMLSRAGKLLPVQGAWQLEFWARSNSPGTRLAVVFRRHGSRAFLSRDVVLGARWERFSVPFSATDDGPYGPLELSFEVRAGDALIDDTYLGEATAGTGGFRAATVAALHRLRPGYLRDWQGQLADTFDNRMADPSARRPTRHRPGDAELIYHYSLPDFLALCAAVDARPWVVAPPLMSAEDWRRMGEALAAGARRYGFDEVLVEFGNENWNELFRPAGFMSADTHAAVADRAFAQLQLGAGSYRGIVPVVNAQFVNPASWGKLAALSREAKRIAVAPYFLYRLDQTSTEQAVTAAFGDSLSPLREGVSAPAALGKRVAVYEVNFHTTHGNASSELRDRVVAGAHSGAALAQQLLGALLAGVREQSVYGLAGFDAYTADRQLVRLWGVARDLAPGRLRPTGLALQMLNRAADGDAHAAQCSGDATACGAVTAVWFLHPQRRQLVVASRAGRTLRVRSGIACSQPVAVDLLDGSDPMRNNEQAEAVRIEPARVACDAEWAFDLPARSVAVLRAVNDKPGVRG